MVSVHIYISAGCGVLNRDCDGRTNLFTRSSH